MRQPRRRNRDVSTGWAGRIARAVAVTVIATTPVLVGSGAAGAQVPPVTVPAPAPTPAAGPEVAAQKAMGAVTVNKRQGLGWVVDDGVVVTSDIVARSAGESAVFSRTDSTKQSQCYVARHVPSAHLAVLRCAGVDGAALEIAKAYPAPGQPLQLLYLRGSKASTISVMPTGVLANDIDFMSHKRPMFAMILFGDEKRTAEMLDPEVTIGSPLIDAEGKVVSTVLVAPEAGGAPIGTTPKELSDAIDGAGDLPATFGAAAVISVGKKAFIPVLVGIGIGVVWAVASRRGNLLAKVLGAAAAGLFLTVGWAVFGVLTTGPETLLT